MKNHKQLLEEIFNKALIYNAFSLPEQTKNNLHLIAKNSKNQKGVFTVLTTLLIHKIYNPKQDIRRHQTNIEGGFFR